MGKRPGVDSMEMMSGVVIEIRRFAEDIAKDLTPLTQRLEEQRISTGCNYLKAPLPLDRSSNKEILITQELISAGNDAELFFDEIRRTRTSSSQDRPIYCSAATSGVGKTHLAYATGKYLTTMLIRVASGFSIDDPFTSPWKALMLKLRSLDAQRGVENGSSNLSMQALVYVKLLIYSYVDATLIALEHSKDPPLDFDRARLREMALRFNRNGRGENYVKTLFMLRFQEAVATEFDVDIAKAYLRDYRNELCSRLQAVFEGSTEGSEGPEMLLVCFDEIQELLGKFRCLFIQRSGFGPQENCVGDENWRDLFYGVACAMGSLTRNCGNWAMHMTGTSMTISKLHAPNGVSTSLLRNQIKEISIRSSLLDKICMKNIIQFYWDIPDNSFTEEVLDALDRYRGRPLFFIEGAFKMVCENSRRGVLTSVELLKSITSGFESVQSILNRRIRNLFEANRPIAGPGDRTLTSVIPTLLKSLMCGTGKVVFTDDADIARAITDGVILVSSTTNEIDLRQTEPLVYDCLLQYLSGLCKTDRTRLIHLVLNQIRSDSGATAEELFSYWLALETNAFMRENNASYIRLGELLSPLYDGNDQDHFPRRLLNDYLCQATKVVNLKNAAFYDKLGITQNDGGIESINTSTIFYNIDVQCGLDIAVIVKHRDTNHYKLVAIQSKNDKAITVKEALLTLSPGTQYLQNTYRKYVITKEFPGKKPVTRTCGPGFNDFDEWYRFCKTYETSVGNNWIRVALVSRSIDPNIHQYVSTEQFLERFDKKTKQLYWTIFARKEKKMNRLQMRNKVALVNSLSPLVFLSLSAPHWLTSELRDRFVNTNKIDEGITFPNEKKLCKYWVPVSVDSSREALIAI